MSADGLLFITAPEADHKAINKILLRIRDWQYEGGDCFKLLTSKNPDALRSLATATSPPVPENVENAWKGASLEEVEEYLFELDKEHPDKTNPHANSYLYIAVDEEGLKNETCVLAERVIEWDDDPLTYPRMFNRTRLSWDETYLSWCNLNISNIGWDEFMEEEEEGKRGGWWTYKSGEPDLSEAKRKERDEEIERLRKEGKI